MGFMSQFPQQYQQPSQQYQQRQPQHMRGQSAQAATDVSNMTFQQFMERNRGKSVEDAYREYGIDLASVLRMLGR